MWDEFGKFILYVREEIKSSNEGNRLVHKFRTYHKMRYATRSFFKEEKGKLKENYKKTEF